jgi:hypothetical protein
MNARPILILAVIAGLTSACATPGNPSASAVATASLQASVSAEPSFTPEPTPTPGATPSPPAAEATFTHADFGSHAMVVVDRLRLRSSASTTYEPVRTLDAGQELLIVSGPIDADGYRWFYVELPRIEPLDPNTTVYLFGWVAALPTSALPSPPDDAWLIRFGDLTCPDPVTINTEQLALLTEWALGQCGVEFSEARGLVDTCYEGPMTPFVYEPPWLWFSCYFLRERGESGWGLPVFFPPDFAGVKPERGDIVTLTGRLGYDMDRYGRCTVTAGEDFPPEVLSAEQQRFASSCRYKFVVDSVKVRDHVELPPLF